jgi:hypothetical protein
LWGFFIFNPYNQEVWKMKDRIKQVLDGILERFKSGDIPEAVAYSMYPMADDIPSRCAGL